MDIFGPQLQGYNVPGVNPLALVQGAQQISTNQQIGQQNALLLQEKQQQMEQQNALMQAIQRPGAINQETGDLTPMGQRDAISAAPHLAIPMIQKQALAQQQRNLAKKYEYEAKLDQAKVTDAQQDALLDANIEKYEAYKAALPKFGGDKETTKKYIADQVVPVIGKRLAGSGLWNAEEADRIANARTFDPDETEIAIASLTSRKHRLEQQKADEKLGTLSHAIPIGDKLVTMEAVRDPDTGRIVQKPMYEAPNPALMRAQTAEAGGTDKYKNVQPDGKGGMIGLNPQTGQIEPIPMAPGAQSKGSKEGLTVADKMNPVMLATVRLDVTEGNRALDFMESKSLDEGSPFYANPHPGGAIQRFAQKLITPEKQQEFDVYANKLGQAIASAQSMGRGQISDRKIEEAQKSIPVMGDSKKVRELKMQQLHLFFKYVDDVLKTPIKADARSSADDQQDVNDFSHLWK
jgi:hypothetical protein